MTDQTRESLLGSWSHQSERAGDRWSFGQHDYSLTFSSLTPGVILSTRIRQSDHSYSKCRYRSRRSQGWRWKCHLIDGTCWSSILLLGSRSFERQRRCRRMWLHRLEGNRIQFLRHPTSLWRRCPGLVFSAHCTSSPSSSSLAQRCREEHGSRQINRLWEETDGKGQQGTHREHRQWPEIRQTVFIQIEIDKPANRTSSFHFNWLLALFFCLSSSLQPMTIQFWSSHRVELSIYKEKNVPKQQLQFMDSFFCLVDSLTRHRSNGSSKCGSNEPIRQSGQSGCLSDAEHRLVGHWHLLDGLVFRLWSDEHEVHPWLEEGTSHCTVRPFVNLTNVTVFRLLFRSTFSVASIFLGYGGLFLLLWVGIFVWMATEEWWIFRATFVFFVGLDVIRVDSLSVMILVFGACWWSFLSAKKSQDELLSSFLDSILHSSFSMFLIPQFVHIQSTGKIRFSSLSHRAEISALLKRKSASKGSSWLYRNKKGDTSVSMLTEWMSIEGGRNIWQNTDHAL